MRWVPPVSALTARRAGLTGAVLGLGCGSFLATQELTYAKSYPTLASRLRVQQLFGGNAALDAIAGQSRHLDTVMGFAAWKCLVVLLIVVAVASIFAATRLLRGEEEAGRADLLATGSVTRTSFTAESIAGLGIGVLAVFVLSSIVAVSAGRRPSVGIPAGQSVYFCLVLASEAACWLAIGALASQLAATRRQASGMAGAVIGLSFVMRMLGDSHIGLSWLNWISPLGWAEEARPYAGPQPVALVPILAAAAAAAAASVALARHRDLGSGILPQRDRPRRQRSWIATPVALDVALTRWLVAAWVVCIALFGVLMGVVAEKGGQALTASAAFERMLARLGIAGGSSRAYLSFSYLIMALVIALLVANLLSSMREEEAAGRLETLVVTPVSRLRWLAGRVAVAAVAALAAGVVSGVFTWLGVAAHRTGVPLASLLQAGLNTVPQAWCLLGLGVVAFGFIPRATSIAAYTVITWSFVVSIVGSGLKLNHFLLDTSLVHHMASVPITGINWVSAGVLVAIGAAGVVVGGAGFARRDLRGA